MSRLLSSRPFRQLAGVASGTLLGLASVIAADEESGKVFDTIQQSVQAVFAKCRSAVVRIEAVDRHGPLSGTGFLIDPNGTIYTSYTVGGETRDIHVMMGGDRYMARRLVSDLRSGVAILKIEAETPFLPFGDSRQLGVASPVVAVGFPMDLPLTPAFGTVAGFDLKYQGRCFATAHLRANIPVQRGEGGAPLLNTHGEVVGILISRLDAGNAAFALPIEAAEKVRKDFVRFHEVRPGWIGVKVRTLETPVSASTASIDEILPEGPAEKAGLLAGDVLLQVGKLRITCLEDLINASFFLSADDETTLRILRDGFEHEFSVIPIDHPDLNRPRTPALGSTGESPTAPSLKIDR